MVGGTRVILLIPVLLALAIPRVTSQESDEPGADRYRVRYSRSLNPNLGSDEGWLAVGSAPLEAGIDGGGDRVDRRVTPFLVRLPAGTYRMTLSLEDYGRIDVEAVVRPGELCAVDVPMAPEYTVLSAQSGDIRWSGSDADQAVVIPYGTVRVTSPDGTDGILEPVYPREDQARILGALVPVVAAGTIGLTLLEALVPIETPTRVPLLAAGGSLLTVGTIAVHVPIQFRRRRFIEEFSPPVPTYFEADARALMEEARQAAESGDTADAVSAYGAVIDRYDNVPVVSDALVARARLLFADGDYDAALRDLERAVYELPSPDTIDQAGLLMAEILYVTGAESEIATLYEVLPMLQGSGTAAEFASFESP